MKRIGLLSDTHGTWDDRYQTYFSACDEIWHAGDIGDISVTNKLSEIAPVRAVLGNIDGGKLKNEFPYKQVFNVEGITVFMTHIGGYPGKYAPTISTTIRNTGADLFVCGHSHILRIIYDKKLNCLTVNPGAAGTFGFHKVRTLLRFIIDGKEIKEMEIIELGPKG